MIPLFPGAGTRWNYHLPPRQCVYRRITQHIETLEHGNSLHTHHMANSDTLKLRYTFYVRFRE